MKLSGFWIPLICATPLFVLAQEDADRGVQSKAVALENPATRRIRAGTVGRWTHSSTIGLCWLTTMVLCRPNRSGRGKILAQSFGNVCIHTLVFFFQRNGQSENLAFRQLVEVLHGAIRLPMRRLGSKPRRLNRRGAQRTCRGNGVLCLNLQVRESPIERIATSGREDARKLRIMDSAHRASLTVLVFCNLRTAHVVGYSVRC